jgi:hypothetical protein
MAIKYVNVFQSKALQKFTQIGIFGMKTNHLATLIGVMNGRSKILCLHNFSFESFGASRSIFVHFAFQARMGRQIGCYV